MFLVPADFFRLFPFVDRFPVGFEVHLPANLSRKGFFSNPTFSFSAQSRVGRVKVYGAGFTLAGIKPVFQRPPRESLCSGDTCEKISGILSRDSKKIEKLRRRAKERRDEKTHRQARRYQKHLQSRCWRRFLGYLGAYRGRIAGIVALILLTALFEIVLPQIVRFVLDVVVPRKDYRLLGWTIAAGAGCYLLHAAFRYLEQRSVVDFSLRLVAHIRRDLFAYQLSLPLDYFEKNGPGRLLSKLTYSTTMIKLLVETFAYTCLRTLVLIALIVIAAAFIDLKLTLILLLLAPLVAPPLAARAAGVRDLSFTTFFEAAFDFTFVFALAFAFDFFAAFRVAIPCSP
ncbi:MAG: hypothetical protein DCC67_16005 [Planctomycetota bacterium]|nr:MAG: hypothetical protein DCC67_16005 [Planctomycetota bacterium]